jgi:hypothetical protein
LLRKLEEEMLAFTELDAFDIDDFGVGEVKALVRNYINDFDGKAF